MDGPAGTAVLTCVLAAMLALGGTAGATSGPGESLVPQTDDVDPDGVVLRADVAADGSATWTVEYRIRLDDPNVTEAFEGLRADIRANRSAYTDQFAARMGRTVAAASNATGREMRLANVSVAAETRRLPQEYGVVSYRFEWIGFARVDGDRLIVGDALAGLFLDAKSRLIVSWPESYEATTVAPAGDGEREGAVVWDGPIDFGPEQPRIVLRPAGGLPAGAVAAGVVALLGAVAAALAYRRRRGRGGEGTAPGGDGGDTPAATGGAGGGVAGAGDGTAGEDDAAEPPEELLSPEERVLRLVREQGGRVKQQAVVEEFDWTAARTSQVVGSLREDGRIETFRLGRENVLTLPDTGVVVEDEGDDGGDDRDDEDGDGNGEEGAGVDWRPD